MVGTGRRGQGYPNWYRDMNVALTQNEVVYDYDSTKWSHENTVRPEEAYLCQCIAAHRGDPDYLPEKGRRIGHELPRLNNNTKYCTKDLSSAYSEPLREQTCHIRAEWNRVRTEICGEDA